MATIEKGETLQYFHRRWGERSQVEVHGESPCAMQILIGPSPPRDHPVSGTATSRFGRHHHSALHVNRDRALGIG